MELQIDAETLDGMTIREWRQEAIDRRKELIAHLEGKGPKKTSTVFNLGDRVRVRANADCGVGGKTLSSLQTDGDIISEIISPGRFRLQSCPQFFFHSPWLEHA